MITILQSEERNTAAHQQQFYALHLLRGIAAILVMLLHLHGYLSDEPNFVPSGHLAVDLFFVLSGYVIAYSYDNKLQRGLSCRTFIIARIIRLAPLYSLSLVFAALVVLATILDHGIGVYSRLHLMTTFAFSGLLLPTPPSLSTFPDILFPLNGPAWSLFFELLVNLAYGAIGIHLGRRALLTIMLASGCLLVVAAWQFGTLEGGATWLTYPVAIPRVVFSFSFGVLIYRYVRQPARFSTLMPWLLTALTIAILTFDPGDKLRPFYNLVVIMAVWPLLMTLSAQIEFGRRWQAISRFVGEASYGIYVMHTPVLNLVVAVTEWMTRSRWAGHGLAFAGASILAIAMMSMFLSAIYDRPLRRMLSRRLAGIQPSRPRVQTRAGA